MRTEHLAAVAGDFRHTLRAFRRAPSFVATAILTLATGIGLSTAVFTVADALLLRPLPVIDQERLVLLWGETEAGHFADLPLDYQEAREFARETRAFESVAFVTYEGAWPVPVLARDELFRMRRALVSGNFFDVLGTRALLGRALRTTDDVRGAAPVIVLSYRGWQRAFGGDPAVVGRRIQLQLDGVTYTIVGVMARGLEYPAATDFWGAVVPARTPPHGDTTDAAINLLGRLAPGSSTVAARQEATNFFRRQRSAAVFSDVRGVAQPVTRVVLGNTRPAVLVFITACGLLLLITCVNVGTLLLVRGLVRTREIAVRAALGASRARIVRQLLLENALLAAIAGVLGVLIAAAVVRLFLGFAPTVVARLDEIAVNGSALAGGMGTTTLAMLLFGLAPAFVAAGTNPGASLGSGGRQTLRRGARVVARTLVAAQVALATTILTAAALLSASLLRMERVDLGFDSSHLLIAEPALRYDMYSDLTKQRVVLERMVSSVQAVAGVRAVSPVVAIPFSGNGGWDGPFSAQGQPPTQARPMLNMDVVTPEYFSVMQIRIEQGRAFTPGDRRGAPPVVVLNRSAARTLWPGMAPLGKHVVIGSHGETATVVGVVPDARYRDLREARPSIYFPLAQSQFPFLPMTLAIRTDGAPGSIVPALRRALAESAPGVGLESAEPFESLLGGPLALPRLNALLLAIFAAAALLIAAVGLHGVVSAMVRQRQRELAIRLAVGASPKKLQTLVMREAIAVVSVGIAAGVTGSFALTRSVRALLFESSPTDPAMLGAVLFVVSLAALAGAFAPARRAARTDPARVLRAE